MALRNRINRMGKGFGGTPDATSYELIMHLWSEEDAQHELEMPMLSTFNAYDYSVCSGRPEEECAGVRSKTWRAAASSTTWSAAAQTTTCCCPM